MRLCDGEQRLAEFLRWAAQSGISDAPSSCSSRRSSPSCLGQSLVLAQFPDAGGRGLAAARDLARGERVLTVPKSALLTSESVLMADERLAACVKRRPELSAVQILIVCLLAEMGKGRRSRWYLYLTQLPQTYNTLSNFTQFEIKSLQVPDAIWTCDKISARARTDWEEALGLMREIGIGPWLTGFKPWLWASAAVSSRALHVPWDEAGCLCPVGDFFNYDAPADDEFEQNSETRLTDGGYEELESAYCFYARKSYKKGEQVLLCYGTYTNLELLEHYGFLPSSNPGEKVFVSIEPGMEKSSSWPRDAIYIQMDGKPSFALLAALRLWGLPLHLRKTIGHRAYSGLQLSLENEASAMKWLERRCQEMLVELPTRQEQDSLTIEMLDRRLECSSEKKYVDLAQFCGDDVRNFLQANGDSVDPGKLQRFRLALQWRLCYKTALRRCISFCKNNITTRE